MLEANEANGGEGEVKQAVLQDPFQQALNSTL